MNIVEMLQKNAAERPDKTAIIHRNERISYARFHRDAMALAGFLAQAGVRKGDRVGLLLEKGPEAIVSFLGVAAASGVVVPINQSLSARDIQATVDLVEPAAIIASSTLAGVLGQIRLPCGPERIVSIGGRSMAGDRAWEDVMAAAAPAPAAPAGDGDVVYLNMTSGSTGAPKAALTTHANLYWNTVSSVEALELGPDDIHACMFPVFGHPHELFARPLYLGGTIVMIDGISPKSITAAIAEHGVTSLMAIASICQSLVHFHRSRSFKLPSLRMAESGGMHASSRLVHEFRDCFGVPMVPVWGSTETAGVALANSVDGTYRPGSMGRPAPHYEVRVVADHGGEAEADEVGEMAIRGPGVCPGYFRNSSETAVFMREGWFYTGDLVRRDADGYFFFAGRRNGMMKVAGLKVFPTEIEEILSRHPGIAEVAVVKAADPSHGEAPKAFVVPKDGSPLTLADIREYCRERMAAYKIPRHVELVKELPKSPGGKILYRKLSEMCA